MKSVAVGFSLLWLVAACEDASNSNGSSCDDGAQECAVPWDCPLGYTCAAGCCVEYGCEPGSCGAGTFCDGDTRECTSVADACLTAPNGCECRILNSAGEIETSGNPVITMAPGSETVVEAVLAVVGGGPLPGAAFDFSASEAALFSTTGSTLTATADGEGGEATLTANVGTYATCQASLVHLGASPDEGSMRVYVFDDTTGLPVSEAAVVINAEDTAEDTDDDGIAIVTDPGSAFTVTVFKAGYNYLSVVGIPTATNEIALPLSARPVSRTTGGFTGKVDFSDYEDQVFGGDGKAIHLGFVSSSFKLASLLNFDPSLLLGPIADPPGGCESVDAEGNHPAGCYEIAVVPGQDSTWAPLPGGLIISLGGQEIKSSFDVVGAPGRRYAWSLGGQIESITDIPNSLLGILLASLSTGACNCDEDSTCTSTCDCDNDCLNFGTILNDAATLLTLLASGVEGNLPLVEVEYGDWENYITVPYDDRIDPDDNFPLLDTAGRGRLRIGEPLHDFTDFTLAALPDDPAFADRTMEGMIILTGVNSNGVGFVPLGVAAGLDCTASTCLDREGAGAAEYDGHVNGGTVCLEDPDEAVVGCPPSAPEDGTVGADHIGLFHAPPHNGLQDGEIVTVGLALPITSLDSQSLRATAKVVRGQLGDTNSGFNGDFPTFPSTEDTQAESTFLVSGNDDSDVHWVTVTSGEDPTTGQTTRWNIYFPGGGGTFQAPDPKVHLDSPVATANPFDPDTNGVGNGSTLLINATHVTFEASDVSLVNLVANDGPSLANLIDHVDGFTVTSRDVPVTR